jgi:hypothetical protein
MSMDGSFPVDLTFIQNGRDLEVEAIHGGRRSNELTTAPAVDENEDLDESPVAFTALDDIMETDERTSLVNTYVEYAERAFQERNLVYPFVLDRRGDRLAILTGSKALAEECAKLGEMVSKGNEEGRQAKAFEKRAVRALHKLTGGWCVCLGTPRDNGSGCEQAVRGFRELIIPERGPYFRPNQPAPAGYPPSGDFGADAFWILGRTWGGPIVFLQAKNAPFNIRKIPTEFHRISDVLYEWFGRRMDRYRSIIPVFAVNTMLTRELKERAFEGAQPHGGFHIIDAVDILHAEQFPHGVPAEYNQVTML